MCCDYCELDCPVDAIYVSPESMRHSWYHGARGKIWRDYFALVLSAARIFSGVIGRL